MTDSAALLVERDLFFQAKITPILARAGYQPVTASGLPAAQRALAGGHVAVALVNCAVNGVDWREAIRLARAAGVPVVAFAPHVDTATHAEARALGASAVIANSKLTPADLPGIIARARAHQSSQTHDPKESEQA